MIAVFDSRQIHLWCAFPGDIQDAALLADYRSLLNETERRQEARFHFARDRHRYLVTRALVRTTLSRYAAVAPQDWTFESTAHGRPCILNTTAPAPSISFNISHSSQLVVVAVTRDLALGVDTEDSATRRPPLAIADRYFAQEEVRELRSLPAQHQLRRFFQYWTLKESYIKARGLGLALPLGQFRFNFPGQCRVGLSTEPSLNDDAAGWRFWQFSVSPAHIIALCARRMESGPQLLTLKQVVPLREEGDLSHQLIVQSGD